MLQVRATIQDLEHQLNHARVLELCVDLQVQKINLTKAMHLNQLDTVTAALEAAAA